jgi:hypothetical protein
MNRLLFSILLLNTLLLVSCSKKDSQPGDVQEVWVYERYEAPDKTVYRLASALEDDKSGYILYSDGKLTSRGNSSWCGTPPVVYHNYENGRWQLMNGSEYNMESQFWGGVNIFRLQVVRRTANEITIKHL